MVPVTCVKNSHYSQFEALKSLCFVGELSCPDAGQQSAFQEKYLILKVMTEAVVLEITFSGKHQRNTVVY